ncbi:MAG: hypothetical protein IKS45_11040 [Thermoguttaceae bacterium]|nr:hypothetical protein [Thermoguttaceae bacterium]
MGTCGGSFQKSTNAESPSALLVRGRVVRRRNFNHKELKEHKELKGGNEVREANVVTLCLKRAYQNDATENFSGSRT